MEIKDLDKKQYILLTLLITFVVSIATGIVTVSLMNQMPKNVPQTINNVIQRTIEKVTTVQVPVPAKEEEKDKEKDKNNSENNLLLSNNSDALISIYLNEADTTSEPTTTTESNTDTSNVKEEPVAIGQGVIISDIGLVLADSSIFSEGKLYKVVLDDKDFNLSILKQFGNGFTILKISAITDESTKANSENTDTSTKTQ